MSKLWEEIWKTLTGPRERTGEPDELAIWRQILQHRDDLDKDIEAERVAPVMASALSEAASEWLQERAKLYGEDLSEEVLRRFGEENEAAVLQIHRDRASQAKKERTKIDKAIAKRPPRTRPPEDIRDHILAERRRQAVDAVYEFLRLSDGKNERIFKEMTALFALLRIKSPEFDLSRPDALGELARWAKREWKHRPNRDRARYIVAKVAGIAPESRLLR